MRKCRAKEITMGLYFRRRFSPFSLFHLNLTGRGIGLSLGVKGFHAGISASGRKYVSASIPGTGLYMRHYAHAQPHAATIAPRSPLAIPPFALVAWWVLRRLG
jgi:Protein of unknown function (DUF4236)